MCPHDCPLRKTYEPTLDTPLPAAPIVLTPSRVEACEALYSNIKEWQTRLLRLEPGNLEDELIASLIVVDVIYLSRAVIHGQLGRVQYSTLSYTWGADLFPRSIIIDGVLFPITENLHAFLQRCGDVSA